ncbi:Isocitrate dehydrogenase [NAD] subunit gamma 1, mitochondrial [Sparganum proliferum]
MRSLEQAWRPSSSSSSSSSPSSPSSASSPTAPVSWDSSGSHVVASGKVETPVLPKYALPPGYATLPRARYGGRHTVAMLLGDGVSPEMMGHVKTVFRVLGAPIDFDEIEINSSSDEQALKDTILAIQRNGVALKGSLDTLPGMKSKNLAIRNQLGLFAYVQHCYTFPGVKTRHSNVDITVIRENTEGEYSQLEHESVPGVVESLKIITQEKSERIAKFAFDYAIKHGRKKVTAVHKANIMKLGDGLFLNACAKVSKLYPSIEFDSIIIDNCCMQLVSRPQQFDVLVLPNLYGNIVGNLAVGLVGGAGIAAGMNLGDRYTIFETGTRKSARSLRGQSVANPLAMLLASADMLEHLGISDKAAVLQNAIVTTVASQNIRTPDLGGLNSTTDVVTAIVNNIAAQD